MEKNEIQKKMINEADYIDITVFIRAFLRLARNYLLLVCPIFLCLTAGIGVLSRVLVKEQYVAEASFTVGVTLMDDFSYNYTLPGIRDDYVVRMSEAFKSVVKSEYMNLLIEEELGGIIPGDINWENVNGTNMGGIYVVSNSMENAKQLRDAVINCLPKALFTTLGDIEIKALETSNRKEISHEILKSPIIWVSAGFIGSVFAYLGIIFLITIWRHDIETSVDMAKVTNLQCLGILPKSGKFRSDRGGGVIQSRNTYVEYTRSFSELRIQLEDITNRHQVKTLLFTGGYKKRGQKEILDKLNQVWINHGKKVLCMSLDLSNTPKTIVQIQDELNQQIDEALQNADLVIINGPDYEQTVELLSAADCVDGIVYIVKAGYDQMEITEEAICTLGFSKAKLLGYVITG